MREGGWGGESVDREGAMGCQGGYRTNAEHTEKTEHAERISKHPLTDFDDTSPSADSVYSANSAFRNPKSAIPKWRILYVRPRFEKKVHQQLLDIGIDSFLPLREEIREWSDRKKKVIVPLFNGYIFVRVDERQRIKALEIYGVLKYIHFSGVLVEVRPAIIESIRIAVSGPRKLEVLPDRLPEGTPVKVVHGPLSGLRGELSQYRGSSKVAIFIDGIRQSVVVEVDLAEIEVVGGKG